MLKEAAEYIKRNEGQVKKGKQHVLYDDAHGKAIVTGDAVKGVPTIGYGRNVLHRGLSEEEANYLLMNDVEEVYEDLRATYPFFEKLSYMRKVVMIDLQFNMGKAKLSTFKNFLTALEASDYKKAAAELLDSNYAKQVGKRAYQNADFIKEG